MAHIKYYTGRIPALFVNKRTGVENRVLIHFVSLFEPNGRILTTVSRTKNKQPVYPALLGSLLFPAAGYLFFVVQSLLFLGTVYSLSFLLNGQVLEAVIMALVLGLATFGSLFLVDPWNSFVCRFPAKTGWSFAGFLEYDALIDETKPEESRVHRVLKYVLYAGMGLIVLVLIFLLLVLGGLASTGNL